MSELRSNSCFPRAMIAVDVGLSLVDGAIAVLAFWQLIRIHSRTSQLGWTRQKVLHFMIGFSNFVYLLYFILTVIATCKGWSCWGSSCGFIFMACPKILFLAVFLLLLSFWVDLYHQGDDEEDEEESGDYDALLEKRSNESINHFHRRCFTFPTVHIGSRQKIVVLVMAVFFLLMILFAVLIWIGMENNAINPSIVARIYVDLFTITVLLLGGALASYGIHIYMKMSNVRSESSSNEMWKVMGLASVSLVCFTTSSIVALLTDVPVLYSWHQQYAIGMGTTILVVVYDFIGSSVPSAFVLWIMRELPPPTSTYSKHEEPRIVTVIRNEPMVENPQPQRWTTITSSKNQVPKASPI